MKTTYRQLCATTSLKVSPFSKHGHTYRFDATHYSFHLLSDLSLLFNTEEIDDADPTDCEESSQELEEDV